ncbi:MAG: CinA family nicotinamide mononucleotide deamidase-related protein [Planctomycetota bacterium]|nr:CinA family nicotinamide mononucleotide deamidase-related protein [Planctomycetota bacterium]
MRVSSLAIGDELLDGRGRDTHGPWISERLVELGCVHFEHQVLPDDQDRIADQMKRMATGTDLVIVTGGLGPTSDDLTRDALAQAAGVPLVEDAVARETLEVRYRARGRTPGPGNLRQAQRPADARCLPNPHGTAPGISSSLAGTPVVLLPGPPLEMRPMFESEVVPLLDGTPCETSSVQSFGLAESDAADRLGALADRDRVPLVCFKVTDSVVCADIQGPGAQEVARQVSDAWHPFAFGSRADTLASVVHHQLNAHGHSVVTAESCTGGLIGSALTSVAGSSSTFLGGYLTYSNELKNRLLGIPLELIERVGAVSRDVALVMAMESARRLGSSYALATTGIAGPGGGTPDKPVGTVWIGLADASGGQPSATARRFRFPGTRAQVRDRTVKAALQILRLHILGQDTRLLWEVE